MSDVSRSVCLSVCVLGTSLSDAKTDELIEILFGADSYLPKEYDRTTLARRLCILTANYSVQPFLAALKSTFGVLCRSGIWRSPVRKEIRNFVREHIVRFY